MNGSLLLVVAAAHRLLLFRDFLLRFFEQVEPHAVLLLELVAHLAEHHVEKLQLHKVFICDVEFLGTVGVAAVGLQLCFVLEKCGFDLQEQPFYLGVVGLGDLLPQDQIRHVVKIEIDLFQCRFGFDPSREFFQQLHERAEGIVLLGNDFLDVFSVEHRSFLDLGQHIIRYLFLFPHPLQIVAQFKVTTLQALHNRIGFKFLHVPVLEFVQDFLSIAQRASLEVLPDFFALAP